MFEQYSKEPFLAAYNLNRRRLAFLLVSTFSVLLVILAAIAATGNKGDKILAIGLFGLALYLSLAMTGIGVAVCSVVVVRRQPYWFWICSTIYAAIPFLFAVAVW